MVSWSLPATTQVHTLTWPCPRSAVLLVLKYTHPNYRQLLPFRHIYLFPFVGSSAFPCCFLLCFIVGFLLFPLSLRALCQPPVRVILWTCPRSFHCRFGFCQSFAFWFVLVFGSSFLSLFCHAHLVSYPMSCICLFLICHFSSSVCS